MKHCQEGFLRHDFLGKENKELFDLRLNLKQTLKNPVCAALNEPVRNTILQIEQELSFRGISFSHKVKQAA